MSAKILVVDDEWSMRELLKETLSLSGYEVILAADAEEFRQKAFSNRPDLIILDLMLGAGGDGTQVYDQLLAEGLDAKIPVIFISALAGDRPPTFPQAGRKYALIGKPFDPDDLVQKLKHLIHS